MRRQATLQYFTSAQFFDQRRRQLIARPQATQGLLGNAALLPRKPALAALGGVIAKHRGLQPGQAFLAQALHQPAPATCLPANSGQPPALSAALPW